MMIDNYVTGQAAAAIFGAPRADEVWRAIRRHGDSYPSRIDIIRVGKTNAVNRDELTTFAQWYRLNVHKQTRPVVSERRRVSLRRAIESLRG